MSKVIDKWNSIVRYQVRKLHPDNEVCLASAVKNIIDQRNKMLEALIKVTLLTNTEHDYVINAIESTGELWKEIKKAFYE